MGDRLATIDMGRKVGEAAVLLSVGEAGSPSNPMSPGLRPTSVPSGILIHTGVWPQQTLAENRVPVPFSGGARSPSNKMSPGPRAYLRTKWHLDPPSHRKLGGLCPFWAELGSHLTQCRLVRGLSPYQVASQSIQPFGHSTPTLQTGQTDNGPIA